MLTYVFIPTLFGGPVTDIERKLISLPTRYGGLNIHILSDKAPRDYLASTAITKRLTDAIKSHSYEVPSIDHDLIRDVKNKMEARFQQEKETLMNQVSPCTKRMLEVLSQKGSSNWLVALPIQDQGFVLNRTEFVDALNLRYGRELRGIPRTCVCGAQFNVTRTH